MVSVRAAGENTDLEDKPSPPRPLLLKRGPYTRGGTNKLAQSTTTTTTPPPEEIIYDEGESDFDEGELEEEPIQEVTTTTTESPRKINGGVRPFRSNDDLLAALKRRRAEAANGKTPYHSKELSTAVPEVSSHSSPKPSPGKKRFQNNKADHSFHTAEEPASPAPAAKPLRARYQKNGRLSTAESEITVLESSQQPVEIRPKAGFRANRGRF